MGKAIPVTIGGEFFAKKGDLEDRIRALISKYPLSSFLDGEDQKFFLDLVKFHPRYEEKLGPGIVAMQIAMSKDHNNHCLYIHRADGSVDDISWTKCVALIR